MTLNQQNAQTWSLSILLVLCRELVTVMFRYHNRFFAPRHYTVNTLLVVNTSVNVNKPICYWAKRDYTIASKDRSGINQCKKKCPTDEQNGQFHLHFDNETVSSKSNELIRNHVESGDRLPSSIPGCFPVWESHCAMLHQPSKWALSQRSA